MSTMSPAVNVVAAYQGRVREELADLPSAELEEVIDDIASHLVDVSDELGEDLSQQTLVSRLGTPQEYAAELRAAAGYPPRGRLHGPSHGLAALALGALSVIIAVGVTISVIVSSRLDAAAFVWSAIALLPALLGVMSLRGDDPSIVTKTGAWRTGQRALARMKAGLPAFIGREAREVGLPVWWAARGGLGGIAVCYVVGGLLVGSEAKDATVLSAAGFIGAFGSVWLARVSQSDRRWLWLCVPLNAVACTALLLLMIAGTSAWLGPGFHFNGVIQDPIFGGEY